MPNKKKIVKKTVKKSLKKKSSLPQPFKKTVVKKSKPNPEQFAAFKKLKSLGHNLILNTGFNPKLNYVAELNNPFNQSHPAVRMGRNTTGIFLSIPKGMTGDTLSNIKDNFKNKHNVKTTTDGLRKVSRTVFETIEMKKNRKRKTVSADGTIKISSGKSTRQPGVSKKDLVLKFHAEGKNPKEIFDAMAGINVDTTLPSIRWWIADLKKSSKETESLTTKS